jgi:hypothetical protein
VEASVPDHLLAHLRENCPSVLLNAAPEEQYKRTLLLVNKARSHGLEGMGDITNFAGLGFLWGPGFDEHPAVALLLAEVKTGKMSFDEALQQMPPTLDAPARAREEGPPQ